MIVKPLVLLGKSSKSRIEEKLSSRFMTWSDDWIAEDKACTISIIDNPSDVLIDSIQLYQFKDESDNVLGYCFLPHHEVTTLTSNLFLGKELEIRGKALSPSLSQLLKTALAALFSNLNNYQDIAVSAVESHQEDLALLSQHYVQVEVKFEGNRFILMMPSDIVRWSYVEPVYDNQLNENRHSAVLSQQVKANVTIGNIELTVDMLSQLREGDTIEMDKKLDEPLNIIFTGTELSFLGYLGKHNNQYAFKINQ